MKRVVVKLYGFIQEVNVVFITLMHLKEASHGQFFFKIIITSLMRANH